MPDLLVYSTSEVMNDTLRELGIAKGFRVKASTDLSVVREWLKLRQFDIAFVHGAIPLRAQEELAGLFWKENLAAPLYVFDFATESRDELEIRLYGAEVAVGPNALATLGKALDSLNPVTGEESGEFRILVVEDLDSPRDIICVFVEGLGYGGVDGVGSVKEALRVLDENPGRYSCIITDIRMPELTGEDLIKSIRMNRKLTHLPIIVLTAYGTTDCLVDCLKAGASGFLVKPPKKEDMTRELGRAVRIKNYHLSPRLARPEEAEAIRSLVEEKGMA